MKKKLISIYFLFITILAYSQSSSENYLQTRTYLEPVTVSSTSAKQTRIVEYYNQIGQVKQTVGVKMTPAGKDLVTPFIYDNVGRAVRTYLPVPKNSTNNGSIYSQNDSSVPFPVSDDTNIYSSEKIFTEKVVDDSPLNKIVQQRQVGDAWSNKPITYGYDLNTSSDVKKYIATFDYSTFKGSVSLAGKYNEKKLYKNIITDEDGNQTIEFKNDQGQILMVRKVLNDTDNADTYYVYNDYEQLAFVIPPLASDSTKVDGIIGEELLNNLCYQYRYDNKNRLVEKRLPGKGWEYMVYDKQDRLVLTRDNVLEAQGKWLFTKYDQFSRPIYTGILDSPPGRAQQVVAVEGLGANNEVRTTSAFNNTGIDVYYTTNSAYPQYNFTLLSVNYYDTYPDYSFKPSFPTMILGQTTLSDTPTTDGLSTKGLAVMSLVKNVENNDWAKNFIYYDKKGRSISTYSINHLGGRTKVESRLDFAGVIQQTITAHKRLDTDTDRVITENFTYDQQNRLLTHTHQVDSNPVEYLAQNSYNELSQLSAKKVGGISPSSPLQDITYNYNIRGWMTKINDPANLNGKLFGYQIKYNNPENTNIAPGRFNGNIAEIDWNNGSENLLKRYNYTYDRLNRLTNAFYKEPSTGISGSFDEYLTYDFNGNISNLKRYAPQVYSPTATKVDDLEYQYTGNLLTKITESALNDTGYEGGNNTISYDLNGNMIDMKDKGIDGIAYNHLNLPDQLSMVHNNLGVLNYIQIDYLYRADGKKLRKSYSSRPPRGLATITTTDYLDGFQYNYTEGGGICLVCRTASAYEQQAYNTLKPPVFQAIWKLDFVATAEGFYSFAENRYIYQYKDHLGNVRVSYAKNSDGILEIKDTNNYYAFGMNHIAGVFGTSNNGGLYSYKYNGKELQETGMYDYGARFYMPDIGRWGVLDPLAETSRRWSPYSYAYNNPIRFIDPDGRQVYDWGKRGNQWEWNDKVTKDNYKSMGYSDYSDGYSNNVYDSNRGSKVTLGPGGPGDWVESMNYYEGKYHANKMYYGEWFSQLNAGVSSFNSTSFDFTAADFNAGLKNFNFEGLDTNLNIKLLNLKGGLSVPYLIGSNYSLQGYLEGTVAEAKLSFALGNSLSTYVSAKGLTGFFGANIQTNNYGGTIDVGAYGALAEFEGNWTANSPGGRWGVSLTGSIPVGASGAKGGGSYFYNPKNDSFSLGVSGTVADGLGLGGDVKINFPNPFAY